MSEFEITREIGIDMGHRVTHHGSKCRNLHGHRYTVHATCVGPLYKDGEQQGMVIDFGFLKEEMMLEIDEPCDHGTTLWIGDPLVATLLYASVSHVAHLPNREAVAAFLDSVAAEVFARGRALTYWAGGKLYLIGSVPTAEELSRHWFNRLAPRVHNRTHGLARLVQVKVWETPNCFAIYRP